MTKHTSVHRHFGVDSVGVIVHSHEVYHSIHKAIGPFECYEYRPAAFPEIQVHPLVTRPAYIKRVWNLKF